MDPVTVRRAPDGTLYTVPVSPESQQRLDEALRVGQQATDHITDIQGGAAKVAVITLALGEIRGVIPGFGGVAFGALLSGTGVSTGRVPIFGPSLIGNFAPAPIGYLPQIATGVPPNYYLPAGSSQFIPHFLDFEATGFPQQRAADAARAATEQEREAQLRRDRLAALTAKVPTQTLESLSAGVPVGRSSPHFEQIRVFSFSEQRAAATNELATRGVVPTATTEPFAQVVGGSANAVVPTAVPAPIVSAQELAEELLASAGFGFAPSGSLVPLVVRGGAPDPLGGPVAMGSSVPQAHQPVNDAAKRNQRAATGLRRELHSERADP